MGNLCRLQRIPREILSLTKVRDLIYYEGPLLAEYRNPAGEPYLYWWCGTEESSHNNWLVFRVSKRDLVKFRSRRLTLFRLIQQLQGEHAYVIEIDRDIETKAVSIVELTDIPNDWLPGEDSFYEPEYSNVLTDDSEYSILIDSEWEFHDLATVPRKYLQMHDFLYWMHGDDNNLKNSRAFRYNKSGKGFSVNNLFKSLHTHIMPARQPHLKEIQYSSPGFIRMKMDRNMGELITAAVAQFAHRSTDLAEHYNELHNWTNGKAAIAIPDVIRILKNLINAMGYIEWKKIEAICKETEKKIENQLSELKNVVFAILAYYRIVQTMAKYQVANKISLL